MIECNTKYKLLEIWKTLFAYFQKLISLLKFCFKIEMSCPGSFDMQKFNFFQHFFIEIIVISYLLITHYKQYLNEISMQYLLAIKRKINLKFDQGHDTLSQDVTYGY